MMLSVANHKPKILVADDESSIRRILCTRLSRLGYEIMMATNGKEALDVCYHQYPNLIILDVMMPELNGFQVCQTLREKSDIPIIMLSALSDVSDRITGLELGADDFMVKPFSIKELEARVDCILRRIIRPKTAHAQDTGMLQLGLLKLDSNKRQVYKGDQKILLTQIEFDLLELLASHPEKPVTRAQFLERVWGCGSDYYYEQRVVDVHISRLRNKLNEVPGQREQILPVRKVGYLLKISEN